MADRTDLLISHAEVHGTLTGVFGGFAFAATIFLVQFRASIAYGDAFLAANALLTFGFVIATVMYADVSSEILDGRSERATHLAARADDLGLLGFLGLVLTLILMTFTVNIFIGSLSVVAVVILLLYWLLPLAKRTA